MLIDDRGATAVEYGVIAALIVLVTLASVKAVFLALKFAFLQVSGSM